jgi:hypothetical protein
MRGFADGPSLVLIYFSVSRHGLPSSPITTTKHSHSLQPPTLNRSFVRNRGNGFNILERNDPGVAGHGGDTLELHGLALCLCLLSETFVFLDSAEETFSGPRGLDVLDPDVDALLHVPVVDLLVHDDANGRLGDVVDDARLPVIHLVRHAAW